MGTNYYARFNICDCCGRYDSAHICRSHSTYRAYLVDWDNPLDALYGKVTSVADWLTVLAMPGVEVWDEYDRRVPTDEFVEQVRASRSYSQTKWDIQQQWMADNPWYTPTGFRDPEGFVMEPCEFS